MGTLTRPWTLLCTSWRGLDALECKMGKGLTHRPSTPSPFGSLSPPYLVQPLCTPSPLVFAWATSTPWSPGLQHPLLNPAPSTSSSRRHPLPYFTQPLCTHSPRLRLGNIDTPLLKHAVPLNTLWGLVPSPSPYQCLVWRLAVCRGTCGSHGHFPLLSDL